MYCNLVCFSNIPDQKHCRVVLCNLPGLINICLDGMLAVCLVFTCLFKLKMICILHNYYVLYCVFQKPQEEKYPVGPWLLALFIFVVCGSGTSSLYYNFIHSNCC